MCAGVRFLLISADSAAGHRRVRVDVYNNAASFSLKRGGIRSGCDLHVICGISNGRSNADSCRGHFVESLYRQADAMRSISSTAKRLFIIMRHAIAPIILANRGTLQHGRPQNIVRISGAVHHGKVCFSRNYTASDFARDVVNDVACGLRCA